MQCHLWPKAFITCFLTSEYHLFTKPSNKQASEKLSCFSKKIFNGGNPSTFHSGKRSTISLVNGRPIARKDWTLRHSFHGAEIWHGVANQTKATPTYYNIFGQNCCFMTSIPTNWKSSTQIVHLSVIRIKLLHHGADRLQQYQFPVCISNMINSFKAESLTLTKKIVWR